MAFLPILYKVQEIESRLSALKKEAAQAKINSNLSAVEGLAKQTTEKIVINQTKQAAIRSNLRKSELELKACQEHLKIEEGKLYGGAVTSSRELELIQQKAAEYNKLKTKYEDEVLQLLETDENLTGQLDDLQKCEAECKQEIVKLQQEIRQKLQEINIEIIQLEPELPDLKAQVPAEWLERYERISKSHYGVGIARMKADMCGACHISLSDSHLQKVKRGEDKLIYCENCGRILFF